jgi:ribosomal protein L40E
MKVCPFCIADIPVQALKCRHCGEWLEKRKKPSIIASEPPMFLETPTLQRTMPCPYCGGLNSKDAWKCVYCCKNLLISKPVAIALSLMIGFLSATAFFCVWMPEYIRSQYTSNTIEHEKLSTLEVIKKENGVVRILDERPRP